MVKFSFKFTKTRIKWFII